MEKNVGEKDNLHAQMRKGLMKIIAQYIKQRAKHIIEYTELIYVKKNHHINF